MKFLMVLALVSFNSYSALADTLEVVGRTETWKTLTDNDARGDGSKSEFFKFNAPDSEERLFDSIVSIGERDSEDGKRKVGFARAYATFKIKDLSSYQALYLPISTTNPAIKISILLDDDLSDKIKFRADIGLKYSRTEKVGLIEGGGTIVNLDEFIAVKRGKKVKGKKLNLKNINYFAIQITRSIQSSDLFNVFPSEIAKLRLFAPVIAFNLPSLKPSSDISVSPSDTVLDILKNTKKILKSQLRPLEMKRLLDASIKSSKEFNFKQDMSNEFWRRIASPLLHNSGYGLFKSSASKGWNFSKVSGGPNYLRLKVLERLSFLAQSPDILENWAQSLFLRVAMENNNFKVDNSGKLLVSSSDIEAFLTREVNKCGIAIQKKYDVIRDGEGDLGLSGQLISRLIDFSGSYSKVVFFDYSSFSENVGTYSFPLVFLFYSEMTNSQACDGSNKPVFTKFYEDVVGNDDLNSIGGWRLWQRIFAGTYNEFFVDSKYWKNRVRTY